MPNFSTSVSQSAPEIEKSGGSFTRWRTSRGQENRRFKPVVESRHPMLSGCIPGTCMTMTGVVDSDEANPVSREPIPNPCRYRYVCGTALTCASGDATTSALVSRSTTRIASASTSTARRG
ncbi:Uncharacterised protein [Mycobacterium tuberculosis]|nr:Uncharacterised protein [Mycobacterium tuberculosis]